MYFFSAFLHLGKPFISIRGESFKRYSAIIYDFANNILIAFLQISDILILHNNKLKYNQRNANYTIARLKGSLSSYMTLLKCLYFVMDLLEIR